MAATMDADRTAVMAFLSRAIRPALVRLKPDSTTSGLQAVSTQTPALAGPTRLSDVHGPVCIAGLRRKANRQLHGDVLGMNAAVVPPNHERGFDQRRTVRLRKIRRPRHREERHQRRVALAEDHRPTTNDDEVGRRSRALQTLALVFREDAR